MGKGFYKFRRKFRVGAVIRAVLFGLSLGAMAVAVQWLMAKLTAAEPNFADYAVIGGLLALVACGVMLVILLPTNKRLAKRLDRSLALGEKVQTMIAFRKDTGDMAVLQRTDTDRILTETPKKRVKGMCTWLFVLLPLLACLSVVGTILVPAKEPEAPPPAVDNNFSLTPWQEQALKDLIDEVKASGMEATPKEGTVKQLESLLIQLKNVKKESAMKETVIGSISAIHGLVTEYNTYDLVADALCDSPLQAVRELGDSVATLQTLLIGDKMNAIRESLAGEGSVSTASALSAALQQAVVYSGVDGANEVCVALSNFADALASVTDETYADELDELVGAAEEALNSALYIQATNEEVEETTIYRLLSIFGIETSELPEEILNDTDREVSSEGDYEPDGDDDKPLSSGGYGSGDMIYGSNDIIYDPDLDAYVSYGEVIDGYFAKITEQFVDGNLSEELEELLSDYFAKLFDGSSQKENSEN